MTGLIRRKDPGQAWETELDTGGGGGSGEISVVTVHISSPEILALNTSPKMLIASPGPGKILLPTDSLVVYNFVSVDYTWANSPNSVVIWVLGAAKPPVSIGHIPGQNWNTGVSQAAFVSFIGDFAAAWTSEALAAMTDQPLELQAAISNPTGGDGTIDVTVTYMTVTL